MSSKFICFCCLIVLLLVSALYSVCSTIYFATALVTSEISLAVAALFIIGFLNCLFSAIITVLLFAVLIWMYRDMFILSLNNFGPEIELTFSDPEDLPLDEAIRKVINCIGIFWKQLARELDFNETDIDALEYENKSLYEQIFQMFHEWKRHQGNNATTCNLIEALKNIQQHLPKEKILALEKEGIYQEPSQVNSPLPMQFLIPKQARSQLSSEPYGLNFNAKKLHFSPDDFPWNGLLNSSIVPNMTAYVCSGGHISLPAETELISPLYYISFASEEDKPTSFCFFAELQHSACIVKDSQCNRLQFVVAKVHQASLSYKLFPFINKECFSFSSNSGTIVLPSISSHHGYLVGIVKPWTRFWVYASNNLRSKYYLRVIAQPVSDYEYKVYIVIVKNLEAYIQMIEREYPPESFSTCSEAELSLQEHSPRPFYESGISFYITSSSKNWKSQFTTPSTITRAKLESSDSYSNSSNLPQVTIIFTRENRDCGSVQQSVSGLSCKLRLSGTAPPFSCPSLYLRVKRNDMQANS